MTPVILSLSSAVVRVSRTGSGNVVRETRTMEAGRVYFQLRHTNSNLIWDTHHRFRMCISIHPNMKPGCLHEYNLIKQFMTYKNFYSLKDYFAYEVIDLNSNHRFSQILFNKNKESYPEFTDLPYAIAFYDKSSDYI